MDITSAMKKYNEILQCKKGCLFILPAVHMPPSDYFLKLEPASAHCCIFTNYCLVRLNALVSQKLFD